MNSYTKAIRINPKVAVLYSNRFVLTKAVDRYSYRACYLNLDSDKLRGVITLQPTGFTGLEMHYYMI